MESKETLFKRYLAAVQIGVVVCEADGHRWLQFIAPMHDQPTLQEEAKLHDIEPLRSKQYGSLSETLDVIDDFLREIDRSPLAWIWKSPAYGWDAWGEVG